MDHNFSSILEDCLQRLRHGQSLGDCLKIYPHQADLLLSLLRAAAFLRATPKIQPRTEAIQVGRKLMLARARLKFNAVQKQREGRKLAFRLAFILIVILLVGSLFTANASASSLPGDLLYGVKHGWETVRLSVSLNAEARRSLKIQFAQERRDEIQAMLQQGRQGTLEIEGVLDAIEGNVWTVSGLKVLVEPQTVIEGELGIGAWLTGQVQVRDNGQVVALRICFYREETSSPHTPEASRTLSPSYSSEPLGTSEPKQAPYPTQTPKSMPTNTLTPISTPVQIMEPKNEPELEDEEEPDDKTEPDDELEPNDEQESNTDLNSTD